MQEQLDELAEWVQGLGTRVDAIERRQPAEHVHDFCPAPFNGALGTRPYLFCPCGDTKAIGLAG